MPVSKTNRAQENMPYLEHYKELLDKEMQEKYQWEAMKLWTHNNFDKLSLDISKKTNKNVSESTLKRAFGKLETAIFPSDATLNALALFLGYADWEAFRQFVDTKEIAVEEEKVEESLPKKNHWWRSYQKQAGVVIACLCAVFAFFAFLRPVVPVPKPSGKLFLKYAKEPQKTMPYTLVLGYKLENVDLNKDTCTISYYTFKRQDEVLVHHEGEKSFYITNPEVYQYYLRMGNRIVDSLTVSLRTEGWFLLTRKSDDMSHHPDTEDIDSLFFKNGTLHYPHPLPRHYFTWTSFLNAGHISDVNIDEMTLEAEIKNDMLNGGIPEYDVKIMLDGEYGDKLQVNFTKLGQEYFSYISFGYTLIRGYEVGRGSLATDLSKWRKVKILTKNRFLTIYLDGEKIAETSYRMNFGRLWGIGFTFRGSGMARNISLRRSDESIAYQLHSQK